MSFSYIVIDFNYFNFAIFVWLRNDKKSTCRRSESFLQSSTMHSLFLKENRFPESELQELFCPLRFWRRHDTHNSWWFNLVLKSLTNQTIICSSFSWQKLHLKESLMSIVFADVCQYLRIGGLHYKKECFALQLKNVLSIFAAVTTCPQITIIASTNFEFIKKGKFLVICEIVSV